MSMFAVYGNIEEIDLCIEESFEFFFMVRIVYVLGEQRERTEEEGIKRIKRTEGERRKRKGRENEEGDKGWI